MKKNDLLHFYRNFQIIDVTEQCTFEWYQEPSSCKAYLEVNDATGDFSEGETVTGQSSGAAATVFSSYVDGGRVYVENVSGTFQEGETIQGQSSGQTATVDGFVAERSYPDNIIKGNFPNSIVSEDIDDYLEFESTKNGAGSPWRLAIKLKEDGYYLIAPIFGVGNKVDSNITLRRIYQCISGVGSTGEYYTFGEYICILSNARYDMIFCNIKTLDLVRIVSFNGNRRKFIFQGYQANSGTCRWRIHNIKVLKLLI